MTTSTPSKLRRRIITAAAEAAVPGGTIERVETDSDGAAYEAHMADQQGR